jgi:hypothetical protein
MSDAKHGCVHYDGDATGNTILHGIDAGKALAAGRFLGSDALGRPLIITSVTYDPDANRTRVGLTVPTRPSAEVVR